jgi:hypothetical protein
MKQVSLYLIINQFESLKNGMKKQEVVVVLLSGIY